MNPGTLDRRITIQARTLGRDELMAKRETWEDMLRVWAMLVRSNGRTGEVANSDRTQREKVFRIRWRDNVTPTDNRILYRGNTYKITACIEVGRRDMLDVVCESLEGLS